MVPSCTPDTGQYYGVQCCMSCARHFADGFATRILRAGRTAFSVSVGRRQRVFWGCVCFVCDNVVPLKRGETMTSTSPGSSSAALTHPPQVNRPRRHHHRVRSCSRAWGQGGSDLSPLRGRLTPQRRVGAAIIITRNRDLLRQLHVKSDHFRAAALSCMERRNASSSE